MAANEIHINDVGTVLQCRVLDGSTAVNITAASAKMIILRVPGGDVYTGTASFTSSGGDGRMQISSHSGMFSVAGTWKLQGYVDLGSGAWRTDISDFTVWPNL